MRWLSGISNERELKARFRQYARQLHPDTGGNSEQFILLQNEYRALHRQFELRRQGIGSVREGDTVYVNGTECKVTFRGADVFVAQAKGRSRKAVFRLKDGVGKYEPQFRARVSKEDFRRL